MPAAWIVIVIIWWAVSAISKSKKMQASKAYQQAHPAQKPQAAPKPQAPKPVSQKRPKDDSDGWEGRGMPASPELASAPKPASLHDARPLEAHMHTPVMGMEGEGTEGIDCCHEYMLNQSPEEEPADFLPLQEETENERAKALLQGVIYSEILGRRPVKRYGGKRPAA